MKSKPAVLIRRGNETPENMEASDERGLHRSAHFDGHCSRPAVYVCFQGIRIRDSHAYVLEIQRMNGNDRHTLELRAGDVVRVAFETEKGELRLQICAPDGTVIYRGNGRKASSFTLNIAQTGAYTMEVKAKQARGNIRITIKERNQ